MKKITQLFSVSLFTALVITQISCAQTSTNKKEEKKTTENSVMLAAPAANGKAVAAFAEGCFWCSVHIFEAVNGVDSAIAGYAGGRTKNPTYREVGTETTGHAESVMVYYDPKVVSYDELLNVFFTSQDPTTPDQQGPDRGSSYRSVIFYKTPEEKALADAAIVKYNKSGMFKKPIVTEVKNLDIFYRAEEYHQHYIIKNPNDSYVTNVSLPRFELFKATYKGKLKE
ncbi:peptide-methionine (S)-S-oxide reductase MsrA [Ferruginibacter yonginensis]|uniref:Peptide methionine sulfoxide reductase MsrA n=1 Tax=Ferruginibacter yonginensis TaxID=1310416 RepID=A0ABV8QPA8_9BACT